MLTARRTAQIAGLGAAVLCFWAVGVVQAVPPAAPTGPEVGTAVNAAGGPSVANLWWSSNSESDLKSYQVYRTTSTTGVVVSSSWTVAIATIAVEGTTIMESGLTNEATYYYAIVALNVLGEFSIASITVSTKPAAGAANPSPAAASAPGAAAVAAGGALNLSWTAPADTDLKDYRVFRSTLSGAVTAKKLWTAVVAPGTTRQDAGLTNGATYYFQLIVRDVNLNGSPATAEFSAGPADTLAPSSPTVIVVNAGPGGALVVMWSAMVDGSPKDYRIFKSTNAGVTLVSSQVLTAVMYPGTTHQDAGLANGTTYYYRVTARDTLLNESAGSTETSMAPQDTTAPGVPLGLGAADVPSDQGGALRLSWGANAEPDLKDYGVYRATWTSSLQNKTLGTRIAAPGTTHQESGLVTGAVYYYQVTARDTALNESAGSAEGSAIPLDNTAPGPPAGLGVADVPADQGTALNLSWLVNAEPDLKDYRLYRGLASGALGTKTLVTRVAAPGTTHQDAGLALNTTYYYQLTARDTSLNESAGSVEASAYPVDNLVPAVPAGLGASATAGFATAGGRLSLSWSANTETDLKDYRVYRSTNSGVTQVSSQVVAAVAAPGTTHQDAGLTNGTTYYYRVSARDLSLNESGLSAADASAFPADVAPAVPTGVAAADVPGDQGGALRLSWGANADPDLKDYGVYRATWTSSLFNKAFRTRIAAPGTTHQESGLVTGAAYYFQVTARDTALNESGGSAEASAVAVDNIVPATPAGLTVSRTAGNATVGSRLSVAWTANADPDLRDYRLWRGGVSGSTASKVVVAVISAPGTTHQDAGLVNGTAYYYQLTARDTNLNESPAAAEVSGAPQGAPAPSVTALSVKAFRNSASTSTVVTGSAFTGLTKLELLTDPPSPLAFTLLDDGTATAAIPAGLPVGIYPVRLTAAGGVGTSPMMFSVLVDENGTATVTAVEPTVGVLKVRVEIPPQAFSVPVALAFSTSPVTITQATLTSANLTGGSGGAALILAPELADTVREIRALDGSGQPVAPGREVTLIIPYKKGMVKAYQEDALRVYRLNPETASWNLATASARQAVDKSAGAVRCPVTSFSVFRLAVAVSTSSDLEGVKVYPNPAELGQAGALVWWKGLTQNPTIEIYDASGELVVRMAPGFKTGDGSDNPGTTGRASWDGRNSDTMRVARGIYVAVVTDPAGGRKVQKLVVK